MEQRPELFVSDEVNVTATAAVATVRAAFFDEFFAV
jgi:hypothetical protein